MGHLRPIYTNGTHLIQSHTHLHNDSKELHATNLLDNTYGSVVPLYNNETKRCADHPELYWLEISVLGAILVCLLMLIVTICIVSVCHFCSSNNASNQDNIDKRGTPPTRPYAASPILDPWQNQQQQQNQLLQLLQLQQLQSQQSFDRAGGQISDAPRRLNDDNFKRISANVEDTTKDPSPGNNSSFSANLAPPSPKSISTNLGISSPEEATVKKLIFNRMEQEEAKRHADLLLLDEKSNNSVNNLTEAYSTPISQATVQKTAEIAQKETVAPTATKQAKKNKKRSSNKKVSDKGASTGNPQTTTTTNKTGGSKTMSKGTNLPVDSKGNKLNK